jgi:hypothetical protein
MWTRILQSIRREKSLPSCQWFRGDEIKDLCGAGQREIRRYFCLTVTHGVDLPAIREVFRSDFCLALTATHGSIQFGVYVRL